MVAALVALVATVHPGPTGAAARLPTATGSLSAPAASGDAATTGLASPSAVSVTSTPGIRVQGNRLVNSAGATVVLHGTDMSGTESTCAQNWTTDPFGGQLEDSPQTFAAMKSWDINAVRIPLNEDCWLGINGVEIGGAAYQGAVTKLVGDLEAAGFYVIVDLHWSAPGTQRALSQNPAPDEDHSPAFWESVAATFKHDSNVIFDLFNEPYFYWIAPGGPDAWTCLWAGCTLTQVVTGGTNTSGLACDPTNQCFTVDANWKTAGFNQLIGVIRAAGAGNLIMATGVNWARDLSGWLAHRPSDPNVVASWHSYPSADPSLESECAAAWCWDQVIAALAAEVPVVVGETGDSSAGPETYLPTFLPWADAHHLSYLAWTWNAWQDADDVLVTSMTAGTPTAGEGTYYRQHLRAVA
jgi:hypothetical protein